MSEYIGCTVKQLPAHQHLEAARTAVRLNPSNAPARGLVLPPEHIAALAQKVWGAAGVRLTVSFLDNPDVETRRKILLHANAWGKTANVTFTETASGGQVRIARAAQGYWSYLGTDILHIAANEPTMNLQGFTASGTPDSEFYRVVRHEFGHTLGFPHEHTRPEILRLLVRAKVLAFFLQHDGWDEQTTVQQVLTPPSDLDPRSLPSDVRSIMCYGFSGEVTTNGQPIPGGNDINDEDYALAAKLYPRASPPPPPPPPAGTSPTLEQTTAVVGACVQGVQRQVAPGYRPLVGYTGQRIDAALAQLWAARQGDTQYAPDTEGWLVLTEEFGPEVAGILESVVRTAGGN